MGVISKIADFKSKVQCVKKDANNPFHKSKYATIESVLDTIENPLKEVGLVFIQCVDDMSLNTFIYDIEDENSKISSKVPLIVSKQDMQQLGSAITYARRYALVSMLGLEQEDDDGNMTLQNKPQPQQQYNNQQQPSEKITENQARGLTLYCKEEGQDINKVLEFFKRKGLLELTTKQYQFAMDKIKNKDFL